MPFNADFATKKISRVFIINNSSSGSDNSSSCSRSGGGSGSGSDSTSGCCSSSSSSKILIWTGKYKLRAIAAARVGKYNLGTATK